MADWKAENPYQRQAELLRQTKGAEPEQLHHAYEAVGLWDNACIAQARKLIEWGEQYCTEHVLPPSRTKRFDCPHCMQQLKQEIEDA